MNRAKTILQIPVSKELRTTSEKVALSFGFSSLQEAVRLFLSQLAQKTVTISFTPSIPLSRKAEKRYSKMVDDINRGKNVTEAKNLDELFSLLE